MCYRRFNIFELLHSNTDVNSSVTTVSADEADTTPGLLRGRRHSSWNAGVHAYLQLVDATGITHDCRLKTDGTSAATSVEY